MFIVPLLNHLPASFIQNAMKASSHDAATVVKEGGSTRALEVMYTRYHRTLFSRGFFQGIADAFWHHVVSQPKALRNRLRIVEATIEKEVEVKALDLKLEQGENLTILNVGSGSSRALIHSLHRVFKRQSSLRVRVINIDKDEQAIALGKEIAKRFNLANVFSWNNDDAENISRLVPDGSVDIAEMVGLLDYFSSEVGINILAQIHRALKVGGLCIVANVYPNSEVPFVYKTGWPKMYYRAPEDIAKILKAAGFSREPTVVFEPLKVHMVALARK